MHGFSIGEQYNAQELAVHLRNRRPAANSPILLDGFLDWVIYNALNPLVANDNAVRPLPGRAEIPSAFHFAILHSEPLREKDDDRFLHIPCEAFVFIRVYSWFELGFLSVTSVNRANGISEIEGKAATGSDERVGKGASFKSAQSVVVSEDFLHFFPTSAGKSWRKMMKGNKHMKTKLLQFPRLTLACSGLRQDAPDAAGKTNQLNAIMKANHKLKTTITSELNRASHMIGLSAVLCLWFCGAVMAETYDLTADFSTVQNPNCVWSYGWTESRGSTFNLATDAIELTEYGTLRGWVSPTEYVLGAYIAVTDWNNPGEFVPAGTVNFHPGPLGENSVIRWTAPSAGTCTIQGWFKGNNYQGPTTSDVAILHGATEVFTGAIDSYDVPLNFSLTVQVNAGDTINFNVGYGNNGNYFGDATGISAAISHDGEAPACGSPACAAQVQPPINADGTSIFNGRRGVVPVKFRLTCDGNPTCDLPPATIAVTRTAGGVIGEVNESVYSSQADSGSNFRTLECQYHYNLNSRALGVGTYRVDILIDGQVVGSATFQLE